jgi:glutathione S-transferase
MMTLYDCATAPSPRRARILLAEKGIAHATVQVDLRNQEQLSDAFRAINPQCTVPALHIEEGTEEGTEDGVFFTDNAAIAAYLEARYPQPPLLGTTPAQKADIASWHWRVEFEGLLAIAEAMRNSAPAMANRALPGPVDYAQIPELAQRGLARVQQFMGMLDERLANRGFIAADQFSIVDITAVVAVDFARVVRVKPGEQHVNLLRWREDMAKRPSFSL